MSANIGVSLREHLLKHCDRTELRRIIYHIAETCKYISSILGEYNRKVAQTHNSSGEQQLEVDILSNEILMERLRRDTSFGINEFASEELDKLEIFNTNSGRYSVSCDPVDGSSLADVNLSIGTIVGIYDGPILNDRGGRDNMVAALYVLYGPLTTLMYTTKSGVHEFVLDPTGNYVLATENIRLEEKGSIYSPGGLKKDWTREHRDFIKTLEEQGHKLRYSGGLVADVNQILLKGGGIFTYPALVDKPDGKLRVYFELQQMALLVEQAGGLATNGEDHILNLSPTDIDARSPIYLGSKYEVNLAQQYLEHTVAV